MSDDVNKSNKPVNGVQVPKALADVLRGREDIAQELFAKGQEDRLEKVNNIYAHQVGTFGKESNIERLTTTMSGSSHHMVASRQANELTLPTEVLEQKIAKLTEMASIQSRTLSGHVGAATGVELSSAAGELPNEIAASMDEASRLKAVLRTQKQKGMSTEKIYRGAEEVIESAEAKADKYQQQSRVKELAASGGLGSKEKELDGFIEATNKAKAALEAYQKAVDDNIKVQESGTNQEKQAQQQKLEQRRQELQAAQRGVREGELRHQAATGGPNKFDMWRQGAAAGGSIVNSIGAIGIDDEIKEMKLKTYFAGTANQQFFRKESAVNGDMTALYEEAATQKFVSAFTAKMGGREDLRTTGVNVAKGIGTITDAAESFLTGDGVKGAIANAGAGGADLFRSMIAQAEGLPQGTTKVDADAAARGMAKQISAIPGYIRQKTFDQAMAARDLSIGLGGSAVNMQSDLTDTSVLDEFAGVGIRGGKAAQITSMARQIGSLNGASASDLAIRAGEVEMNTKIMSAEQYMGGMAQLAGVGAGQGDMETIMKNAVAAGMDNAKNVQQMVSATLAMSSNLAKSGLGGAGVGSMVGASIQKLTASGVDKNIAAQAVSAAANFQSGLSTDVSADLGTVFEMEQLQSIAPGMNTAQIMRAASLEQTDIQSLMKMGDKDRASKLDAIGLDYLSKDQLQKMARVDKASYAYKLDAHILGNQDYAKDMQHILAGEEQKVSKSFKANWSRLSGTMFGASITAGTAGVEQDAEDVSGALDKPRVTGAKNELESISEVLSGFKGSMDSFVESTNKLMEEFKTNLKPAEAQRRVAESAEKMMSPGSIKSFEKGARDLEKATNKMLEKMGLDEHTPTPPTQGQNSKNVWSGGGRGGRGY